MAQSADITSMKAKIDNFPDNPANQSSVQYILSAIGTPSSTIFEHLNTIQGKTNTLPSNPAAESSVQILISRIGAPTSTIASDLDEVTGEVSGIKGSGWTDETLKRLKELIQAGGTERAQIIVR